MQVLRHTHVGTSWNIGQFVGSSVSNRQGTFRDGLIADGVPYREISRADGPLPVSPTSASLGWGLGLGNVKNTVHIDRATVLQPPNQKARESQMLRVNLSQN